MTASPFARPSAPGGSGDKLDYHALNGALLLIQPVAYETDINTVNGVSEAIRATSVVALDGAHAGTEYADVLIFPKVLRGQLRAKIGQKVLGRLHQGQPQPGKNPPWVLSETVTEADEALGVRWLNRTVTAAAPVAQPAPQPVAPQPKQVPF